MELVIAFLGLWAFLALAPDAPICRTLHRPLVELPAKFLGAVTRGHVAAAAGLVALVAAAFWLLDHELLLVMSMMAPEAMAYLAMFEIGTLADAILGVTLVATTARFPRIGAVLGRIRQPRTTRARRPMRPTPSNDDEDGAAYACAA
ncbi:MAG: hypothetical protein EOP61_12460 [Sphingomonadales bacterium]|nr:MAG: hypothetical protein EOP61_12460 [Sphingomonadales bacterium]